MAEAEIASLAEARSHNVPPDLLRFHYEEIRQATLTHKETGRMLAGARKAAKEAGLDLEALKLLLKLIDLDDGEAELRLRHLFNYADWLNMPLGFQRDMFGEQPRRRGNGPRQRSPFDIEAPIGIE